MAITPSMLATILSTRTGTRARFKVLEHGQAFRQVPTLTIDADEGRVACSAFLKRLALTGMVGPDSLNSSMNEILCPPLIRFVQACAAWSFFDAVDLLLKAARVRRPISSCGRFGFGFTSNSAQWFVHFERQLPAEVVRKRRTARAGRAWRGSGRVEAHS